MGSEKSLTSGTSSDGKRLVNAIDAALRSFNLSTNQMLPAKVISFDRATNQATVQPLIMWVDMNDNGIARHEIATVPVLSIGGGAFHISFPLVAGDLGWIDASDRDLSLFKQTLSMSKPNTGRCHDFSDSRFIPDVFRNYTIQGEDAGAMVLQSTSGATRISIRGDNIKITAPAVVIDTPTTTFTGNVLVEKTLTVTVDAIVDGVSTVGHGHISSAPGVRTSGGMIP